MAKIVIHAGDFGENETATYFLGTWMVGGGKEIPFANLDSLEIATEANVKKLAGSIGWGIAGVVAFGAVGALAGLLAGGRKKEITFIANFKDGKKILATTDHKTFTKLQASIF